MTAPVEEDETCEQTREHEGRNRVSYAGKTEDISKRLIRKGNWNSTKSVQRDRKVPDTQESTRQQSQLVPQVGSLSYLN